LVHKHLKTASAISVTLMAAFTIAACWTESDQPDRSAAKPADGGVLKVATAVDLTPANFFIGTDAQNLTSGLVYDTLLRYPPTELKPMPSVATSWQLAEDGRSLTLQLRDDVTYHTGRKLTSQDVAFSIKTYADPKWGGQLVATAMGVTGFDTSKPHEITLELAHPMSNILDLLAVVRLIDRESMDQFASGQKYVGTGPFTYDKWSPGSKTVYRANDKYWGGRPRLDGAEMHVVPDPQSQVSQLRAGQVDVIMPATRSALRPIADDDKYRVFGLDGVDYNAYLGINVDHPALADVRLRQAVAFAVDRERIATEVYDGAAQPTSAPWPRYSPAASPEAETHYRRDVAKAEQLLAQTGRVPALEIAYVPDSETEQMALTLQDNLKEAGIETKLVPGEVATYLQQLTTGTFPAMWVGSHTFAQYTPSTLAVSAFPFNASKNVSNFASASYRKAAQAAWVVPDGASPAAIRAYEKLTDEIVENAFVVELVSSPRHAATTADVHDLAWSKRGELDLTKTYIAR
jgi:peptide/nickel transport system substrate-binding protein